LETENPGLSGSPLRGPHPTECDDLCVVPRIAVSLSGEQEFCVSLPENHREEDHREENQKEVPVSLMILLQQKARN